MQTRSGGSKLYARRRLRASLLVALRRVERSASPLRAMPAHDAWVLVGRGCLQALQASEARRAQAETWLQQEREAAAASAEQKRLEHVRLLTVRTACVLWNELLWRGSCAGWSTTPVWLRAVLEAENACIADLESQNRNLQHQLAALSEAKAKQEVDHEERLRALSMETEDVLRHASELEQRLRQSESAAASRMQVQQQEAAHADETRRLEAVRSAPASALSGCSPAVDRAQRIVALGNASA